MVGGPDFVEILRNALEPVKNPAYVRPPFTGGDQVSVRLDPNRIALLNALSERSGWNRNQVVDALIDKGLLVLFDVLSDATAREIIEEVTKERTRPRGR